MRIFGPTLIALAGLTTSALAQPQRPSVTVPLLLTAPRLDDFRSMTAATATAKQMAHVTGLIQREPADGEPCTQRTDVYLGRDHNNLYVVFVAHDNAPDRVRGRLSPRESLFHDDIVEIMLDTFNDQRRAIAFVCNPLGVQWDAIWTEGLGFDDSFDTVWHSEGAITDSGYVVLMAIPFKSLRFDPAPSQEWGLIVLREIRRDSEQAFWPPVSSRVEGRLNQAATLRIDDEITPGRNILFVPYGTARTFRLIDEGHPNGPRFKDDGEAEAGFDLKAVIKDKLVFDLTVNPDFSHVESDQPQVTVNERFEVFFPEQRPFFLENANYFEGEYNLLFTRRISDPRAGGRLTGKLGPWAVGLLLADDEGAGNSLSPDDPNYGESAYFGVARVSRDIMDQSNLGAIFTDREFAGGFNRVGGIDGRIKLTPTWTTNFQAIHSVTETDDGTQIEDPAVSWRFDRSGQHFRTHVHYQDIGRDFATLTGFVPRVDLRDIHWSGSYRVRTAGDVVLAWGPEWYHQSVWDHDGTKLDEIYELTMHGEFVRETSVALQATTRREWLRPIDFASLMEVREYDPFNFYGYFGTDITDELVTEIEVDAGKVINFDPPGGEQPELANRYAGELGLAFKPSTNVSFDVLYSLFQLNQEGTGDRILRDQIARARLGYQFNRELSVRAIVEYEQTDVNGSLTSETRDRNLNGDLLFTYLVNPWTALYVGMNTNYRNVELLEDLDPRELRRTRNTLLNDSRQFFIKYSYLIRF